MTIGARLRRLRLDAGLTQEQIGDICGVSKGMVSQWESDLVTIPIDRIVLLRTKIRFSSDWLIFGDPQPSDLSASMRELMAVAESLPTYAVEQLAADGTKFATLIAHARKSPQQ